MSDRLFCISWMLLSCETLRTPSLGFCGVLLFCCIFLEFVYIANYFADG